ATREADDLAGGDTANRGRPGRVFRPSVPAAQEVVLEPIPADAAAIEEGAIVPPFGDQSIGDTEHQRDIGAGPDGMPERFDFGWEIVTQRADQVEFDRASTCGAQLLASNVPTRAAAANIVVLQRHPAKGQHQGALCYQLGPADIVAGHRP